ncbi:MAG: hypothetical protein A2027_04555 [Thermodesulfovibrio sp. RBG_19FT_COMBO_41_18]|nr:MAG: hypothetical protein A2027_04555 [Thermodesulfovibrio sp. RBG_19FT_COMBO_41_18]
MKFTTIHNLRLLRSIRPRNDKLNNNATFLSLRGAKATWQSHLSIKDLKIIIKNKGGGIHV